jgi:hypothetical protein
MIECAVYHTGFLAVERYGNAELDKLANVLLARAERGEVTLVQRRLSLGVYEYLAIENRSPSGFRLPAAERAPPPVSAPRGRGLSVIAGGRV